MRFPPPLRKAVVTAHVVTSVGWLGAEAVLLVLAAAGLAGADRAVVYPAAGLVGEILLAPLSVAAWVVGVVSALGTPWGLLRYRWVLVKLVATTVMTGLILFRLLPNLRTAADLGPALPPVDRVGLVVATSVATTLLVAVTAVSVYKPWGRLRRARAGAAASGPSARKPTTAAVRSAAR